MPKIHSILPLLFLIVVGIATYGNNLDGPFIFDDRVAIEENESIEHLWPPWWWLEAPPSSALGRPVGNLSLAISYAISGREVVGYHLANIAIHLLATLVLFGVVRRTLMGPALRDRFGGAGTWLALTAALIWMVHPLQTECVNYLTQRFESLMGLFYLLTLYCAIRAHDSRYRIVWCVLSVLACAAGMGTKQVMVTAPVMVMFYDLVFRRDPTVQVLRRRWGLYAGLAGTWAILFTLMVIRPDPTVGFTFKVGPVGYAMQQCVVIVDYLKLVFWPHPLALDYGEARHLPIAEVAPSAVVLLGVLAATVAILIHRPKVGFALAWVFIILSPTSSFVPILTEPGAERRMYLPLAGLVALFVAGGYELLRRAAVRFRAVSGGGGAARFAGWVGALLAVLVATILIRTTVQRNQQYRDAVAICRSAVEATPWNHRAHNNLGHSLRLDKRDPEAEKHFRLALQIDPDFALAHTNLGATLAVQDRFDEAMVHFRRALQLEPNLIGAHYYLAAALGQADQIEPAVLRYQQVLRLDPRHVHSHYELGALLLRLGRSNEGLEHYETAIGLRPDWLELLNDVAWTLATDLDDRIRNADRAIELAERAVGLYGRENPGLLDTLAAAYAEGGRFDQAVKTQQEAIEKQSRDPAAEPDEGFQSRLELYKQGKPYREVRCVEE